MESPCCESCVHFLRLPETEDLQMDGECRRFPPVLVEQANSFGGREIVTRFPEVHVGVNCGEHRPLPGRGAPATVRVLMDDPAGPGKLVDWDAVLRARVDAHDATASDQT